MDAVVLKTNTPEYGEAYLVISRTDEKPMNSRYDAYLEFALYSLDKQHELDSGTLEYNSAHDNYTNILDAIPAMMERVFGFEDADREITDLNPDQFGLGKGESW